MASHAISGKLYLSISGNLITGAGGTSGKLIGEVKAREFKFLPSSKKVFFKTGRAPDQLRGIFVGSEIGVLEFGGRDNLIDTLRLVFQEIIDVSADPDVTLQSSGTPVTNVFDFSTRQTLIFRPNTTTENHLYIPNAEVADDQIQQLSFGLRNSLLFDNTIRLVPTRLSTESEPGHMWGTIAKLNTSYAALS